MNEIDCARFVTRGQMTLEEYVHIASVIDSRKPCHVLVYGVGNDSELYLQANQNGQTVFVETSKKWIDDVRKRVPHANIIHHHFPTSVRSSLKNGCTSPYTRPNYVDMHPWDVIVVDAPFGGNDQGMGREFPIREAAERLNTAVGPVDVFVHDVDRELEKMACTKFFGKPPFSTYDRTFHYRNY